MFQLTGAIAESNKRTEAKTKKNEEESKVTHEALLAHCRKKRQPIKRRQ